MNKLMGRLRSIQPPALLSLLLIMAASSLGCLSPETEGPQAEFFARLQTLCGQELSGMAVVAPEREDFSNIRLDVRKCELYEIEMDWRVDGAVKETWTVQRKRGHLVLSHRDFVLGQDRVLVYGGPTQEKGRADKQSFPADRETRANYQFMESNIWHLRFESTGGLIYRLEKEGRTHVLMLRFEPSV